MLSLLYCQYSLRVGRNNFYTLGLGDVIMFVLVVILLRLVEITLISLGLEMLVLLWLT